MKTLIFLAFSFLGLPMVTAQAVRQSSDAVVGTYCDGCETMYEGIPEWGNLKWQTALAPSVEPGDRMKISGTVFKSDGRTPAKDVILYIYHTDSKGNYSTIPNQKNGIRNGHLRGWVKTNERGAFEFTSIRPAPYPGRGIPAHIHLLVKEPGKTIYYIDEVWFDDDPLITNEMKSKAEKRGGNMIIHLTRKENQLRTISWEGSLSITLGLNIPNYKQ